MKELVSAIASLHQSINQYEPPPLPILQAKFRAWHVEPLLNQAADLLDRCMSERRELQALDSKRADDAFKINSMISEANLLKSRFDNGWYTVSSESHKKNSAALIEWQTTLKDGSDQAHHYVHDEPPGPTFSKNVVEKSAAAASIKASIEMVERADRSAADDKDSKSLKESIDSALDNAQAADKARDVGGPLWYDNQIQSLQSRIIDDFKDAYERLTVASIGLDRFYGYTERLPTPDDAKAVGAYDFSLLDTTSLWVRAAIRWLVAVLQYEQVFPLTISTRASVSPEDWRTAMEELKQKGKAGFSFWVDATRLPEYAYVRFRGVSGFSPGSSDVWSATLRLPRIALSVQKGDGEHERTRDDIDQTELPGCVLGRIVAREIPREPELAGINSLRNASPFGRRNEPTGSISVEVIWPFGLPPADIVMPSDFQFEFLLAAIPR